MRTISVLDCHENQNPRVRRHHLDSRTSHDILRISRHTGTECHQLPPMRSPTGTELFRTPNPSPAQTSPMRNSLSVAESSPPSGTDQTPPTASRPSIPPPDFT